MNFRHIILFVVSFFAFEFQVFAQGPNPKVGLQVGGNKNPNTLCENDTIQLINMTKDSLKTIDYYIFNYNFKRDPAYPNYSDTFKGKDTAYHIYRFDDSIAFKNCATQSVKIYVSLTARDTFGDDYEIITSITIFLRPRVLFSAPTEACVGIEQSFYNHSCPKDSAKYIWEVNGDTFTSYNVKYTFTKPGTYKVKLTVIGGKPCEYSDTLTRYIVVYDYPIADFRIDTLRKNDVICLGKDTLMFINTSQNYTSINWHIEQSDTNNFRLVKGSNLSSDTVYFVPKKTMTFWVQLTAFNHICEDTSAKKYFKVIISPEMKLKVIPDCILGDSILLSKYLDSSKGVPDAYLWKFWGPNIDDSTQKLLPNKYTNLKYGKYFVELQSNGTCDTFVHLDSMFIVPALQKYFNTVNFCDSKDTVFSLNSAFKYIPSNYGSKWKGSFLLNDSTFNPYKRNAGVYQFILSDTNANCRKDTVRVVVDPTLSTNFKDTVFCITNDSIALYSSYKGIFTGKGVRNNVFIPILADTGKHEIVYFSDSSVKCPFKDTFYITVTDTFKAAFDVKTPGCMDTAYHLINTTSAPTYRWVFSDNTTAMGKTYDKKFSSTGTFQIQLTIGTLGGCMDSLVKSVVVYDKPILKYTTSIDSSQCDSVRLRFAITATDSVLTYRWEIDSVMYTGDSVHLSLPRSQKSDYLCKFKVSSMNLCGIRSDSGNIRIPQQFNAGIKLNGPSKSCTPFTVSLSNSTYGAVDSFWVDYGNGLYTKNSLNNLVYTNTGNTDSVYKIVLTAYSKTCGINQDSVFVTVAPNLINPSFSFNSPACTNTNLSFINTSTDSIALWNFGDLGTSPLQNPQHSYSKKGIYTITANYAAPFGCKATLAKVIDIYDKPLMNHKYLIDSSHCDSVSLRFIITNPDSTQTYFWKVDTFMLVGDTVAIRFAKDPKVERSIAYQILGQNICGNISDSNFIRIPPKFNARINIAGLSKHCTPFNTSFVNNTYGPVDSFRVDYGNGQQSKNNLLNITYTNSSIADSIYKITMVSYSQTCGISRDSVYITVAPNLIKTTFTVKTPGCLDSFFQFVNTSADSIESWRFGDGSSAFSQNASHKYAAIGEYVIQAAYKADFGCKDTGTSKVRVMIKPSTSLYYTIDSSHCDTNYLIVNVVKTDTADSYLWDFGKAGSSVKIRDTIKILQEYADYYIPVKLTATNVCGSFVIPDSAFISTGFHAHVVVNGLNKGCSPFTPVLDNHTTGRVASYIVYYGNGDSSVNSIKKATYYNNTDSTISYKVILKAYNAFCGYRSDTTEIFVRPNLVKPIGQYKDSIFCDKEVVTFINKSSPEAKVELRWGDGAIAYNLKYNDTIKHVYALPGAYVTTLIAESCGVDTSKNYGIFIDKIPALNFTSLPLPLCEGDPVKFANISPNTFTDHWQINGVDTANKADSFAKTFNQPGVYGVTLFANSVINNCPNSISKNITIAPKPTFKMNLDPLVGCLPLQVCSHAQGNFAYLNIDWGNGQVGTQTDTCITYTKEGYYPVHFIATSANGCSVKDETMVTVLKVPNDTFKLVIDSLSCDEVRLIGNIMNPHALSNYTWFYNAKSFAGDTFIYTDFRDSVLRYHNLNISVTNICGSKSINQMIEIPVIWNASISVNGSNNGCDGFQARFFNYSTGNIDSFSVDYGNGQKSHNQLVTITYTNKSNAVKVFPVVLTIYGKGCPPASDTTYITVYPNTVKLGEEHLKNTYCDGEEIYFINRSDPGARVTFHFGDGSSATKVYFYGDTIKHTYARPGKYQISASTFSPCFGDSVYLFSVDILDKPAVDFILNQTVICQDFEVKVTNNTPNVTNLVWVIDNTDSIRQLNDLYYTFTTTGSHSIQLMAESATNDCKSSASKSLQVMPRPSFTMAIDTPVCVGQPVCIKLQGNLSKASVNWGNGEFGSLIDTCTTFNTAGKYNVVTSIESTDACIGSRNYDLLVHALPKVVISPDLPRINLNLGDSVYLRFNDNQPYQRFFWTQQGTLICDNNDLNCTDIKVGPYLMKSIQNYQVSLIDPYGCMAMDEIFVHVIGDGDYFVPNAFSPNRDGVNDLFKPVIYDPGIDAFDMKIYNRWGELLYQKNKIVPNTEGWNGIYMGKDVQLDVYMVLIQFYKFGVKNELYKGVIHVMR